MIDDRDTFDNGVLRRILWEVEFILGLTTSKRFAIKYLASKLKGEWREMVDEELRERGLLC